MPLSGPVWVPCVPVFLFFNGPHPRLTAYSCVHRTPHFSMKNSITFPYWFFIDFGTVLGGKLAPSWHQNPKKTEYQNDIKKWVVKIWRECNGMTRRNRGSGPLKSIKSTFQHPLETYKTRPRGHPGTVQGHSDTPLRASKARWRIYTYNYVYIIFMIYI